MNLCSFFVSTPSRMPRYIVAQRLPPSRAQQLHVPAPGTLPPYCRHQSRNPLATIMHSWPRTFMPKPSGDRYPPQGSEHTCFLDNSQIEGNTTRTWAARAATSAWVTAAFRASKSGGFRCSVADPAKAGAWHVNTVLSAEKPAVPLASAAAADLHVHRRPQSAHMQQYSTSHSVGAPSIQTPGGGRAACTAQSIHAAGRWPGDVEWTEAHAMDGSSACGPSQACLS